MNFKEYISEHAQLEEIKQLEIGSVLIDKEDVFKEIFKTERHPKTDKKYTQAYISLIIEERVYTYKVGKDLILITGFGYKSIFKLNYKPQFI